MTKKLQPSRCVTGKVEDMALYVLWLVCVFLAESECSKKLKIVPYSQGTLPVRLSLVGYISMQNYNLLTILEKIAFMFFDPSLKTLIRVFKKTLEIVNYIEKQSCG